MLSALTSGCAHNLDLCRDYSRNYKYYEYKIMTEIEEAVRATDGECEPDNFLEINRLCNQEIVFLENGIKKISKKNSIPLRMHIGMLKALKKDLDFFYSLKSGKEKKWYMREIAYSIGVIGNSERLEMP